MIDAAKMVMARILIKATNLMRLFAYVNVHTYVTEGSF
jgi:hypothetical protein